jgi:hypothetical protein
MSVNSTFNLLSELIHSGNVWNVLIPLLFLKDNFVGYRISD